MSMAYEEYMKQIVKPMRAELTNAGFEELTSEAEVDELMKDSKETTFIVVNSVCGCAAGLARPAATQAALNAEKKPEKLVTVFAGQDKEATSRMREYFKGYEPSSPSMALMKNGEVVHFIPRHDIEGNSIENIMENLQNAFDKHC
ncbi:BrxA/BrxB family bacilliredoxin [Metabacillus litoralis]|uniref:BrxA/BrxB family bacilliredoxin n=1 Tax=Metabacillus litoralis TaxID=152268 RepID=A0A5C6WBI4_9BACI|nr:BrxA/BrxB family bacilliredoxin [Metabacillus litoralis]TXC93202.1 BrxA/BrxB family bacilliredoxin [Metabacillus litoralis]